MKIMYVGGTGQISFDCIHESIRAGHEVWVFNRGNSNAGLPPEVKFITGDMNDDTAYSSIVAEGFDVLCQFRVFDTAKLERDLRLFAGKVGQYVFISTASAYQKPVTAFPITEDVPLINPYWEYSRKKAACEALLTAQSALPWTIVRPSHTSRDSLTTSMGEGDLVPVRMLQGKPVILPGDGTSLWTITAAKDFARPFVKLLGNQRALSEAFHITADRPYKWNQIYEAMAKALGAKVDIAHVPTATLVKINPDWEGPLWGDKSWSVVFDNSKVKSVAGDFRCDTTLEDFMAERAAAFLKRQKAGGVKINAEHDALHDRIVAMQRSMGV